MSNSLTVAVLGCGNMGWVHASAYSQTPGVKVAGVFSRSRGKAKKLATRIKTKAFTNADELLDNPQIRAVDICLPTEVHKNYIIQALKRNKHVFCEVPMASSAKEANEIIEVYSRNKTVLGFALLLRFVPERIRIKELINSGELGEIISIYISKLHPPYWLDGPPHYYEPYFELLHFEFDFLTWAFGPPRIMRSYGKKGNSDFYEYINVCAEVEKTPCTIEASTLVSKNFPLTTFVQVIGTKGVVQTTTRMIDKQPEVRFYLSSSKDKTQTISLPPQNPYENECRYFIDCIKGKSDPDLISPKEAIKSLESIEALRKKLQ